MMKDWQVVIPWIGPVSLLDTCIGSMALEAIERPIEVLVVDNTPGSDSTQISLPPQVEVIYEPQNLGIAASWNLGLKRGARWTLLLSAAMSYTDGLEAVLRPAEGLSDNLGIRFEPHAFHHFAVGRDIVDQVGLFDPAFWPKEYEDTDYIRRMKLAGIDYHLLPDLGPQGLRCAGNAIAGSMGLVQRSEEPRRKYVEKWGSDPGQETRDVPAWSVG